MRSNLSFSFYFRFSLEAGLLYASASCFHGIYRQIHRHHKHNDEISTMLRTWLSLYYTPLPLFTLWALQKFLMQQKYTLFIIPHNNCIISTHYTFPRCLYGVRCTLPTHSLTLSYTHTHTHNQNTRHCPIQALFLLKCLRKQARAHRPRDKF